MDNLHRSYDAKKSLVMDQEDQQPLMSEEDHDDRTGVALIDPCRTDRPSKQTGPFITYHFVPRWPMTGNAESALGPIGDKEYTVRIIQKAFPALAELSPLRIEFLAPMVPDAAISRPSQWSKIMDEAWGSFESDPPARLLVQVADLPGQREAREQQSLDRIRRADRKFALIMAAILCPAISMLVVIFFGLIVAFYLTYREAYGK